MTDPVLSASNISKTYPSKDGEVSAVSDVSFSVGAGELVALHGPSGCGKSTLLMIAGGLLHPDSGDLEVAGKSPYASSNEERAAFRAKHLGFVFQEFHLIPYLPVIENVLVPTLAEKVPNAKERANELLRRFGLGARLTHTPSALSTGEQQRVALARALIQQPKVVLADEPTGNLDPENAATIMEHLQEVADEGAAVLMVTHSREARSAASRSLRMEDGKLV